VTGGSGSGVQHLATVYWASLRQLDGGTGTASHSTHRIECIIESALMQISPSTSGSNVQCYRSACGFGVEGPQRTAVGRLICAAVRPSS